MASLINQQVNTGVTLELTGAQVLELRRQLDTPVNAPVESGMVADLRHGLSQRNSIAKMLGGAFSGIAGDTEKESHRIIPESGLPECSIPSTLSAFKSPASGPPPPPTEQAAKSSSKGEMSLNLNVEFELEHECWAVQKWGDIVLQLADAPMIGQIEDLVMRDTWLAPATAKAAARDSKGEGEVDVRDSQEVGKRVTKASAPRRLSIQGLKPDIACVQSLVLHPHSDRILAWKIASMVLILWDTLVIPLEQFELGSAKEVFDVAGYITSCFWFCDFVLSFFTGVDLPNGVEMRWAKILKLYSTSWLPFDVTMLTVDVTLLSMEIVAQSPGANALGGFAVLRVLRLVRLLRVVRLGKVAKLTGALENHITDMHTLICARILSGLFTMLLVNHFIACAWLGLGYAAIGNKSWLNVANLQHGSFAEVYVAALHWSITQFMPATNNVAPESGAERVFAVFVVLLAMGVFSSFISSITNSVNALRSVRNEKVANETNLRLFFTERDLSSELFHSCNTFCKKSGAASHMLDESQVALLQEVPEHLQIRLHAEMYGSTLCSAVWMNSLGAQPDERLIMNICHSAIGEKHHGPQYEIFSMGLTSNEVLIPRNDNAKYSLNDFDFETVPRSSWLSEVSLWAEWFNAGWLRTHGSCTMVAISSHRFCDVCAQHAGQYFRFLKTIAVLIVGHVDAHRRGTNPVTDLPFDEEIMQNLCERGFRFKNSVTARKSRWLTIFT